MKTLPGLQDHFNELFGTRDPALSAINPYHQNRARGTFFGLSTEVETDPGSYQARLLANEEVRTLARLLRDETSKPAGGWYLVREHRQWLAERCREVFARHTEPRPLRILEAGVASYLHHFTYLSILGEALAGLSRPPNVELVVADICFYPLHQIEVVGEFLPRLFRTPSLLRRFRRCRIDYEYTDETGALRREPPLEADRALLSFLLASWEKIRAIQTTVWHQDLSAESHLRQEERFDLITEHFLTSMSDKNLPYIRKIRRGYQQILRPGGRLLCAAGLTHLHADREKYQEFLALHARSDLNLLSEEHVWDVYDLDPDQVQDLFQGRAVFVEKENNLMVFERGDAAG